MTSDQPWAPQCLQDSEEPTTESMITGNDVLQQQTILEDNMMTQVQLLHHAGSHLATLDFTSYQYFSDAALTKNLIYYVLNPCSTRCAPILWIY